MRVINKSTRPAYFRDDDGKHRLMPKQSREVVNDAHLPAILASPGIELVTARKKAGPRGER